MIVINLNADGTVVSGHSCAIGCFVGNVSPDQMSYRGISAHIQVRLTVSADQLEGSNF